MNLNSIFIILYLFMLLPISVSSTQFESFKQSFNLLNTIAGKGSIGENGNEWNTSFEGKSATEALLSGPHFAIADSEGNVFIADKDAHAIRKVNTQGIITTAAGINNPGDGKDGNATEQALKSPNGLWVNKHGELYILDLGNSKLRKVNTAGIMTTLFKDDDGMVVGRGLWVSKTEDTIWYCNGTEVKMWTESQGIILLASGFSSLGNIMQDNDGNIIATDRGANKVYRIDNKGAKSVIAGNGSISGGGDGYSALETAFNEVRGIWILKDDAFLLATHEGSQLWYIDNESKAHLFLDGKNGDKYHSGDGEQYDTPGFKVSEIRSVTVDYQGNIIITENDRGFIRKINKFNVSISNRRHKNSLNPIKLTINSITGTSRLFFAHDNSTNISFSMCNSIGQNLNIPFILESSKGIHSIYWENRNLSSGTYYLKVHSNSYKFTKTIHVIK